MRTRVHLSIVLACSAIIGNPSRAAEPDVDFSAPTKVLQAAIADRAFPGCVALVGTAEGPLWTVALGRLAYDANTPVALDSVYDLASLTKILGTTSVVCCLVGDGKLSLADPLQKHLPEWVGGSPEDQHAARRRVTIEHLLAHASGLPAGRPLYRTAKNYKELVAEAAKTPLAAEPGERTVYSDLGFILLGEAAARAAGKPLAELERTLVFDPLGMKQTLRTPAESLWPRIAPTEKIANDGDAATFLRGVVHDENARAAEGLTGHAGLFGTAEDVGRFAQDWLRAVDGKSDVFSRRLARQFVTRREAPSGTSRALGWDTPSGRSSSGSKMPHAFGHTGFTGTSLWIDRDRGLYVVLLTNRVHPTRANQKIAAVRRSLADAVVSAFDERASKRGN